MRKNTFKNDGKVSGCNVALMRDYHDYEKIFLGCSDIGALTLTGLKAGKGLTSQILHFNIDACYKAYLVDENSEIEGHYHKVAAFEKWVKVYDDDELVRTLRGREIEFFRAGDAGCVVKISK